MARIIINATNVVGSGPKALALSLLPELSSVLMDHELRFLLPAVSEFRQMVLRACNEKVFFERDTGFRNNLLRLKELYSSIPWHQKEFGAEICLTLGDVSVPFLKCPEIVFLQNSLFVYDLNELQGHSSWGAFKSWYLKRSFEKSLNRVSAVVVQTPVMRKRLLQRYSVDEKKVIIISQPVPTHVWHLSKEHARLDVIEEVGDRLKLLFLAQYYPHKNHTILGSVCNELKRRKLEERVRIFVTLDENEWRRVQISIMDSPVVINLGRLKPNDVAAALRSSDALFLPTLVESYGLVYLESFLLRRPVLTSDRDFAHYMSKDFAVYFDPLNPVSVVNAIEDLPKLQNVWPDKQCDLQKHLEGFPQDWKSVAASFKSLIERVV